MTTPAELYSALKYCVKVDRYGTRRYYNHAGQLHRLEGPAVVWRSGSVQWWLNGVPYTEQDYHAQLKALGQTS